MNRKLTVLCWTIYAWCIMGCTVIVCTPVGLLAPDQIVQCIDDMVELDVNLMKSAFYNDADSKEPVIPKEEL